MIDKLKMQEKQVAAKQMLDHTVKQFTNPTEEFSRKWVTAILFCVIFIGKDILYFGTVNDLLLKISQIVMMLCCVFAGLYLIVHKIHLKRETVYSWAFFGILILLSAVFNWDIRLGYLYLIVVLAVCGMLLRIAKVDGIFEFYYKAMNVISVVSVIAFVAQKLFPQIATVFPIVYNSTGIQFRFLVVTNLDDTYGTFLRNWGPFREPGVFQLYVSISLIYGLFKKKQVSTVSILFHILAIITTFSTTGYIVLAIIILATVAQKKETMHNWELYKKILIISCVGVVYLVFFTDVLFSSGAMSYASVFGKLFDGMSNNSMGSRMASVVVNVLMFFERPLFGGGMGYVDSRFGQICGEMYGDPQLHNTNTIFILLATFGLVVAAVAVAKIWLFIDEYFNAGNISKLMLVGAYFCMLFCENVMYSVIVMFPLLYVSKTERRVVKSAIVFLQKKKLREWLRKILRWGER